MESATTVVSFSAVLGPMEREREREREVDR